MMREIIEKQRRFFTSGKTRCIQYRKTQLARLKEVLKNHEGELYEAVYEDFRKSAFETYETELAVLYGEINLAIKKLKKWSRPRRRRTNLANFLARSYVLKEPFGTVLVMGAWNYPYQLSLLPAVSAIAAGNTVVVKPSELAPHSSAVMARIINEAFAEEFLYVCEGGVETSRELLKEVWNFIFFTGSPNVGKLVYRAASEHLTPVCLELGGKSPVIVCRDADLSMAAKRIVWGKFLNSGQTCVAPDYVLVDEVIREKFMSLLVSQIKTMYGEDFINNDAYTSIVSDRHFERLLGLIESSEVYYGGGTHRDLRIIEPTLLYPVCEQSKVMQEEIFGPLLPVLSFSRIEEAIEFVQGRAKPLALYIFSKSRKNHRLILRSVSSGGVGINDTVMHLTNIHLPFGGVGNSGMGAYHGKVGFETFSHSRSVLKKSNLFEPKVKYLPYTNTKRKIIKFLLE